jgi:carbon monoxide dehydrogenase subunit G
MDMTNSVTLPAPQAEVWDALNDPAILKQCINGCETIEKTGENAYSVAMTVAIGPVKAKFKGNLRLTDIDPPNAYTLQFDGQGGVAGFGKGSARVTLAPEGLPAPLSRITPCNVTTTGFAGREFDKASWLTLKYVRRAAISFPVMKR